jgi:hypothetical protein
LGLHRLGCGTGRSQVSHGLSHRKAYATLFVYFYRLKTLGFVCGGEIFSGFERQAFAAQAASPYNCRFLR